MKILQAILILLLYLLILIIIYFLHIKYLKVDVILFSSLIDASVATVVIAGYLFYGQNYTLFNLFEKIQMIFLCILIGYIASISIPTVIDRSLSFYILEKIDQQDGGIELDQFENLFTIDYMRDHRLVDVRLTEQLQSGTIIIQENCVTLTSVERC